jgi:adenosylhomocysteine nucleosidase
MEAQAVVRALGLQADADGMGATGQVGDMQVETRIIGIKAIRLPAVIDAADLSLVISAGLAGGLDPKLRCGDIVGLSEIITSESPVTTTAQKAELFAKSGARAVDMETEAIQRFAERMKLPCIAIRAISDCSSDAIDPAILRFVGEFGQPRIGAILPMLLRRPGLIARLLRLRANSNLALKNLGDSLKSFLETYTPPTELRRITSE